MLSQRIVAYGAPLEPAESPDPEPHGTQVLLEVLACGVCHSDLHYWHGGYNLGGGRMLTLEERGVTLPVILGHEPLGRVVARGPQATEAPLGAARLVYPWIGCGRCDRCAAGHDNDCLKMQTLGLFRSGGYATHLLVPHPRYLLDVGDLEPSYACTLACAGLTAYAALLKLTLSYPDDALLLIGAGGVGLTAVGMARALFDRPIVVVDRDEEKLEAALAAGATHAIRSGEKGIPLQIMKLAGGVGGVIDFVGAPETLQLGLDVLLKGGQLVIVGLHGGEWPLRVPLLPLRNIALVGSLTGTVEETREAIALVRNRPVPRIPVAVRPLDEATQALEDLEAGRVVGRTVLVP